MELVDGNEHITLLTGATADECVVRIDDVDRQPAPKAASRPDIVCRVAFHRAAQDLRRLDG